MLKRNKISPTAVNSYGNCCFPLKNCSPQLISTVKLPHASGRFVRMRKLGLSLALVCILIVPVIAAQLKVDVALVNVVATITDETGHYISDLTENDLTVYEDGQPQKISHFSQANDLPVSIGVLL